MPTLEKSLRNKLEKTVKDARDIVEAAAKASLEQLGVQEPSAYAHLTDEERSLRRALRAHARQLGNGRGTKGEQEIDRLIEEVAYEHWHRMLFARFLAENNLLMYPDPDDPVAISLEECEDLAADEGAANGWELAARYAARMLPQIFRPDSPVFRLTLPPEHQQKLERLVAELPLEVFTASDSLGWVYQFWQAKRKDEVNASEVKIGARELPAVTQLFTEPYMVSFLLDNSLGAWWAARRLTEADLKNARSEEELRQKVAIPGVSLEYLRFVRTSPLNPLSMNGEGTFGGGGANGEGTFGGGGANGEGTFRGGGANGEGTFGGGGANGEGTFGGGGANGEGDSIRCPVTSGNFVTPEKLELARKYRKEPTAKEADAWEWLRGRRMLGLKWRRQQVIEGFIVDFYCAEHRLALEIDGEVHNTMEAQEYDQIREQILVQKGIHVIRIPNSNCIQETLQALIQQTISPSPLSIHGEGGRGGEVWTPAPGTFPAWPNHLSEFKLLDPCCGSGHFLVAAFLMLVAMRMELEGLAAQEAVDKVLSENIHGLEIDQRCVALAAFALALAAWTYPDAGGYRPLPELHLACSGLAVSATKEQWTSLAPPQTKLRNALDLLHDDFQQAPILGSLLNPSRGIAANLVDMSELAPALQKTLAQEESLETHEAAIAAQGLAKAAGLLAGKYHLVVTNVPYLARGKQDEALREFCAQYYPEGKNDLATVFLERCLELTSPPGPLSMNGEGELGGTVSVVLPQNWLFLTSYRKLREKLLKRETWHLVARLGPGAFETISGEVVKAILITFSRGRTSPLNPLSMNAEGTLRRDLLSPFSIHGEGGRGDEVIRGLDVSEPRTASEKAAQLQIGEIMSVGQAKQLENPDARVAFEEVRGDLLEKFALAYIGQRSGDGPRFITYHWEFDFIRNGWELFGTTVDATTPYAGNTQLFLWQDGKGQLAAYQAELARTQYASGGWKQGWQAWGVKGIRVSQMRVLPVTIHCKPHFDNNSATIVPSNEIHLPAIWCFCSSPEYNEAVRQIDQALKVTNATLVKVPFDLDHWTRVAAEKYPNGLPEPYSDDPTQWIFHGHPCGSVIWDEDKKWTAHGPLRTDHTVLHVAVARLLGYRWPAETSPLNPPSMNGGGTFGSVEGASLDGGGTFGNAENASMNGKVTFGRVTVEKNPIPPPSPSMERGAGGVRLADEQREWVHRCESLLPYADDDGIVCIPPVRGEASATDRLLNLLAAAYNSASPLSIHGEGGWGGEVLTALLKSADHTGKTLETWLREKFFTQHCKLFHHRPFIWHIWDGLRDGFAALVNYHKLDRKNLETLIYTYLGDWISRQKQDIASGVDGTQERLAAAENLKKSLELILEGEAPYDIFVRWKPLDKQPIGWEPDLNDGVRLNIRPFLSVPDVGKRGAGVLRDKPNINWNKDRGKDVESAPWFHLFKGDRINDHHLTLAEKRAARGLR